MDKRTELMGKAPIPKAIMKIAVPAIIGMLVMAIYNLVDTLFVSQLGTSATGAVTVAFPLFMLVAAIGLTFGIGSGSYISRMLGAKKLDEVNRAASTAFYLTIAAGLIFSVLGMIFIEPLLNAFGATETIMVHAKDYVFILLGVATIQMCNMTMNNMLRSEGSAFISMAGLAVGALLNIALDPIFIFVFDMGVAGAAVATAISQGVSFIILIQYYIRHKSIARIKIKMITLKKYLLAQIMKIGLPTFFRQALQSIAAALLIVAARHYGDSAIAAVGIFNRVIFMSLGVVFGFGQGFQPVAGYNFGANQFRRLREAIKFSVFTTTIFCVFSAILFFVFSPQILMAFNADPETKRIGIIAFRYFAAMLPFLGFAVTITVLFQAMGHGTGALVLSIARQGIFYIPLILILPRIFGIDGIFISQPIADFLTLIVTGIFASRVFKEIREKEFSTIGK